MNADRFKYKETTDIILEVFMRFILLFFRGKLIGKFKPDLIVKEKISVMISVNLWLNNCIIF